MAGGRPGNPGGLVVSAVAGGVFALALPPTNVYPAVLVGLGGQYWALSSARNSWRAGGRALVWAAAAGIVGMRFVPEVVDNFTPLGVSGGLAALVLLALLQGLAWAAGAMVGYFLEHRFRLDRRVAFGAGVVVAVSLPTVFAWSPAGLLAPWPQLLQLAEHVGERGVSALLAIACALVVHPWCGSAAPGGARRFASPMLGVALLGAMLIHGAVRMKQVRRARASAPTLPVGVVQAAVPARLRWERSARHRILGRLRRLTVESERRGTRLTVWPEAAYPFVLPHDARYAPRGSRAVVGGVVKGPVLFGLITSRAGAEGRYNAATLVTPDRRLQPPQAKMQLLWFGETVPFGDVLPSLRRAFFRAGGLVSGKAAHLLALGRVRMGVLNCYEDTLPGIGRRVAGARPNLLINVTNDAWFGRTAEPELHLRLSVLRTIEARLDMVRAVNLGIPAWIDATGTVRRRGPDHEQGVMTAAPAIATNDMPPTFYTKAGDIPLWLGVLLASLTALWRSRRQKPRADATEPDPSAP